MYMMGCYNAKGFIIDKLVWRGDVHVDRCEVNLTSVNAKGFNHNIELIEIVIFNFVYYWHFFIIQLPKKYCKIFSVQWHALHWHCIGCCWQDPEAKKPEDWDDKEKIDDPEDSKPEGWEKPEHIPDPEAKKPEDWDDEMDGEWEPPQIDNPEYKVRGRGEREHNYTIHV